MDLERLNVMRSNMISTYRQIEAMRLACGGDPDKLPVFIDDRVERRIIALIRDNNLPKSEVLRSIKEWYRLT